MELYERIINKNLLSRRIYVVADNVENESKADNSSFEQINLFTDYAKNEQEENVRAREKKLQEAVISIKKKYGKNAVLKGMNLEEGGTTIDRNCQIGGHKE